jgi:hypothetical protein
MTILFGAWLIGGVFIDGYAHNNGLVETFFTPWHAILYSGYVASATWMVWLLFRTKHATGLPWLKSAPEGYGLGLIGSGIFLLGGIVDMIWHIVFGIEKEIAALLSPTHLVLLVGAVLIITSPYRSAWLNADSKAPGWREFAPPFLSVTITLSVVCFFLMYAWFFRFNNAGQWVVDWYWSNFNSDYIIEVNEIRGLTTMLLNTLLFMFPVFLLMRRWTLPFGAMALLFVILTGLMNVLDGFIHWRSMIVVFGAGLVGDLLYVWLRPQQGRLWAYRIIALAVPAALWTIYFVWSIFFGGIGWSVELWTGSIVESALASLGLSILALTPKQES